MYQLTNTTSIIRLSDGAFIPAHTSNRDYVEYLAWVADGNTAAPAPTPLVTRHITKLAFRQRFTAPEKASIEIAALDSPAAPMAQRRQAAALRANQADIQAATFIDLDRADTRAGVQMLEAAGLLGAGRALAILDAVITDAERHKGTV